MCGCVCVCVCACVYVCVCVCVCVCVYVDCICESEQIVTTVNKGSLTRDKVQWQSDVFSIYVPQKILPSCDGVQQLKAKTCSPQWEEVPSVCRLPAKHTIMLGGSNICMVLFFLFVCFYDHS